jgi:hypothetical protein
VAGAVGVDLNRRRPGRPYPLRVNVGLNVPFNDAYVYLALQFLYRSCEDGGFAGAGRGNHVQAD